MASKTCVITGASRGIGLATAVRFARSGYNVVGVARTEAALDQARKKIEPLGAKWLGVAADLSEPNSAKSCVEATVRHFGGIDVLVNNAGIAPLAKITDMNDRSYSECVELNCGSVFRMTRASWDVLAAARGTIVNVSSVASTDPFPGFAVYGACKAWVNVFTKACAEEGRPLGIRVVGVAPGAVETEMLRQHFPAFPTEQTLGADDVAAMVEAVTHDAFQYATGHTVFLRK
ncbi:MAG: SDR family oxidoreductase [Phycisphaerales bacterium]|nr:SDR family oxidoreductase [Phycisphaerales bacterium]